MLNEDDVYAAGESVLGGEAADLYKVFVQPFVDVVDTVEGGAKEVAARVKGLVETSLAAIWSSINPWYAADYKSIYEREEKEVNEIKAKYKAVYDATDKVLRNSEYAWLAAISFPEFFYTAEFIQRAPGAVSGVLDMFLSDQPARIRSWTEELWTTKVDTVDNSRRSRLEGFYRSQNLIREDSDEKDKKKENKKDVLLRKKMKVASKILNSPEAKEMQEDAQKIIDNTLNDIVQNAQKYTSFNSVQELEKAMKKPIQGLDKKQMNTPEGKEALQTSLKGFKQKVKADAIKDIKKRMQEVLGSGIPEESYFVQAHKNALQEIESIKSF